MDLFDINSVLFTIASYPVSGLELWATLFGLFSVVLAKFNNKHTYTIGAINCVGFALLFFQIQLYSDVLLQGFYLLASIYGYMLWTRTGKDEVKISVLANKTRLLIGGLVGSFTLLLMTYIDSITLAAGNLLVNGYEHIPAALALPDAFTTIASVVAFCLLIARKVEAWALFILVNIVCIVNYYTQGVIVVAAEYVVFLINAIWALIAWSKIVKE